MTYTLKFIIDVITEEMEFAKAYRTYSDYHSLVKLRQKFCEIDNELSRKETENATHDN